MFVKFVFYPEIKSERVSERVVECREFVQQYNGPGDESVFKFNDSVDIDQKTFIQDVTVDCENSAVYVMSDQGKTIDSYKWKKDDRGIIHRV